MQTVLPHMLGYDHSTKWLVGFRDRNHACSFYFAAPYIFSSRGYPISIEPRVSKRKIATAGVQGRGDR
jgi:hypothetical protein